MKTTETKIPVLGESKLLIAYNLKAVCHLRFACVDVWYTCVHVCIEARALREVPSSVSLHLGFEIGSLSLKLMDPASLAGCLFLSPLFFPSTVIADTSLGAWLLMGSGDPLLLRHFTDPSP